MYFIKFNTQWSGMVIKSGWGFHKRYSGNPPFKILHGLDHIRRWVAKAISSLAMNAFVCSAISYSQVKRVVFESWVRNPKKEQKLGENVSLNTVESNKTLTYCTVSALHQYCTVSVPHPHVSVPLLHCTITAQNQYRIHWRLTVLPFNSRTERDIHVCNFTQLHGWVTEGDRSSLLHIYGTAQTQLNKLVRATCERSHVHVTLRALAIRLRVFYATHAGIKGVNCAQRDSEIACVSKTASMSKTVSAGNLN